ncbi:MAG: MATE family efflux transporter, partial [Clostridia bacterium]|nr:MATE family efflux transporter [Clostridia bacterium]
MANKKSMTEGALLPAIIRFTLPVIATGVLQLLFNAADLIVVGRFCGSESVAAVGATSSLTVFLVNFFIGLSVGGGVTVAHALGAKDDQTAHDTVHTAIPLAALFGVVVMLLGLFASEPLLRLMDTPEEVFPLSALYMRIYFCGQIFNLVYNYGAAILR